MCEIKHVDFYASDWLGGTAGLTLEQRGFFITACAAIYDNGGPVERAYLKQLCGVHGHTFNAILDKLLKLGKLVEIGGKIGQKRAQKELKKASNRVQKWLKNVDKSENSKAYADRAGGNARALPPTTNHQRESGSSTESLEPKEESAKTAQAPFFAEPPPVGYAFEGRVIRLTQKDLNLWRRAYSAIPDIEAELQSLDDFYYEQPPDERKRWFIRCSRALGKFHQRLMSRERGGMNGQGTSPATNLFRGFYEAAIEGGETGDCGADWPPPVALLDSQRPAGSAQGSSTGLA